MIQFRFPLNPGYSPRTSDYATETSRKGIATRTKGENVVSEYIPELLQITFIKPYNKLSYSIADGGIVIALICPHLWLELSKLFVSSAEAESKMLR